GSRATRGVQAGGPEPGPPAEAQGAVAAADGLVEAPPVADHHPKLAARGLDQPSRPAHLQYSAPTLDAAEPDRPAGTVTTASGSEPARNAPCPCGSGKKYKRCHGAPASAR